MTGAIKFTKQGYIKMGFQIVPQGVRLYAGDTGCGMTENEGTAQGTTIAKAIVEIYHGEIGAVSSPGKGSTFWAILPLNTGTDDHAADDGAGHGRENVSGQKVSDRDCATVRILVAEDNDSNYMLVKVLLKGYNLTRACNGREAVELAGREKFDIILMDIRMPEMDGAEATRRIREFCPAIPIIAVTANAFDEDRRRAFEAGVDDFLTKPLSKAKLFETINR